ncbi:MAG: hypothetical protein JXA14_20145 [Anaerolineae bacterium]|nr:hypothetical protein [Anaerolineae bacterium]
MNPRVSYWLIGVLFLVGVVLLPGRAVAAQVQEGPVIQLFTQEDLNDDGKPELATIIAEFHNELLRILVYDQGADMEWSEDWRTGTDFLNDVWLFQVKSGEETKLILRFTQSQEGYVAELYDDFNEDRNVSYRVHDPAHVEILESSFPTVRMSAAQYWLLTDGRVNYMVQITILRPLPEGFMQPLYYDYLPVAGNVSSAREVVDSDNDGNPNYELRQLFPTAQADLPIYRSQINVNISNTPCPNFEEALFWPYLGDTRLEDWSQQQVQRGPENLSPPIKVDWQTGLIKGVASFLPYYGLGDQWMILTTKAIEKQKVNELDWEQFAYYDFDGDTVMDALFRLVHQPVTPVWIASRAYHFEQASFAWRNQERNKIRWNYELEVAGLHELSSTEVKFKDFAIRAVPYAELLKHFSRPVDWAYATFVAADSGAYGGNEGIWEWGTLEGVQTDISLPPPEQVIPGAMAAQHNYLRGLMDNSPADLYSKIREGFRGEYADLSGPASLYFSSIDRRLHLIRADKGLWNLGGGREIQYRSLSGVYLDCWILLESGQSVKYLYAPAGYLIYQDGDGVQIFRADTPPALFTTTPPRDGTEWQDLNSKLDAYHLDAAPDDFLAMAKQFGEPRTVISAASLRDFRLTDDGYRFVLTLRSNSAIEGEDLGLNRPTPGEYVVALSQGAFAMQPLTPAQPEIVPGTLRSSSSHPLAFEPVRIEAVMYNAGLEDETSLPVHAYGAGPDAEWQPIDTITVTLLAGKSAPLAFDWTPRRPGEWAVALTWGEERKEPAPRSGEDHVSLAFHVTEASKLPVRWILNISHANQPLALGAFLISLACAVTTLGIIMLRKAKERS